MYDLIISNNIAPLKLQSIYKDHKKILTIDSIAKKHIGFTSIDLLYKNRNKIKCIPILFCNLQEVIKLKLELNIYFLDSQVIKTGEINFHAIDLIKLFSLSKKSKKFPNYFMYAINNKNNKHYKYSKFSYYLHNVLDSIPILLHEPLLVSLTNIFICKDITLFFNFLDINRIVTYTNSQDIKKLINILNDILTNGTKNLSLKDKIKLKLLYKLNKIKDLKNYIDHEKTVSIG